MRDIMTRKEFHKRLLITSLLLGLVLPLANVPVTSSLNQTKKAAAAEPAVMTFAEGEGTGEEFKEESWMLASQRRQGKDATMTGPPSNDTFGIRKNPYSKKETPENVIRLFDLVKPYTAPESKAEEDPDNSLTDYRSTRAMLNQLVPLNSKSQFSTKFTFSLPDACVNTEQAGGEEFAREVGGDGLAFLLYQTDYLSDMDYGGNTYTFGMQNNEKSLMVEMDSQYNGSYCDMKHTGLGYDANRMYYYASWDYDNQLYFHKNQTYTGTNNYENKNNPFEGTDGREYTVYRNYKYAERFDHIGITLNSDHARHDAIYYLNGLDPTKTVEKTKDGKTYTAYENLAYFDACAGGVLDDTDKLEAAYQDTTKKSIEVSDSSTCATRFADAGVNDRLFTVWIDYDGEKMYVRYANGDFANAKRPSKPQIEKEIDLHSRFDNKKALIGFSSSINASKANTTLHAFQFTNEYKPIDEEASYQINYWKFNPDTECYERTESSEVMTGAVGATVTAADADASYATKYSNDYYHISTITPQDSRVTLENADTHYQMNLYYEPEKTTYKVLYYQETEDGNYKLLNEYVSPLTYIGKTVYAQINSPDGYMEGGDYTATFGIVKPNNATILKVYYDKYIPLPEPTEVGQTPSPSPSPTPTATPTTTPTVTPTQRATATPTVAPTIAPTTVPTAVPTAAPTVAPTVAPTAAPTKKTVKASVSKKLIQPVKASENANRLSWNPVKNADGYFIYASACNENGKERKVKKIADIKNRTTTSYTHKNCEKDTWYKYRITAYRIIGKKKTAISKSLELHSLTKGSKTYENPSRVKIRSGKKLSLKAGSTKKIRAQVIVPKGKKTCWHIQKIRYLVSDSSVLTVSKKGKIRAKKAGHATIYAVAQNGVTAKIKVSVIAAK
jgi:hypothetical protein